MGESSINIDLDDPRTGKIASAISNKTCKKILVLLAEKELSEGDLASKLGLPINTTEYNLKILIDAGLVEKAKNYFWSAKGKRIPVYKIANKRIVISPKKMIRGVLPAVLASGIFALVLRNIFKIEKKSFESAGVSSLQAVSDASAEVVGAVSSDASIWFWFLAGALFSLIVYFAWNWIISVKASKNIEA